MRLSVIVRLVLPGLIIAACSPVSLPPAPSQPAPAPTSTAAPTTPLTQEVQSTIANIPPAMPTPLPSLPPTQTAAQTQPPMPTLFPSQTAIPRIVQFRGLSELASGLTQPDDLLLAADGSIYFSDVGGGTVRQLSQDGKLKTLASSLAEPEGIVALPGGKLIVAEQGKNRLVQVDPASGKITLFLDLANRTGSLGVDGITLDQNVSPAQILIPDSPNGQLLGVSMDGARVQTIANGFLRPTGAYPEPGGGILVADENAGEVVRVRPDGTRQVLARMPLADDMIEDPDGNIFAISISEGTVHFIPAGSQEDRILVSGLSSPQGICFNSQGNLVVAEAGKHRLVLLQIRAP